MFDDALFKCDTERGKRRKFCETFLRKNLVVLCLFLCFFACDGDGYGESSFVG